MRLGAGEVERYAVRLSELLERYGVSLAQPAPAAELELLEADDGTLSFELTRAQVLSLLSRFARSFALSAQATSEAATSSS